MFSSIVCTYSFKKSQNFQSLKMCWEPKTLRTTLGFFLPSVTDADGVPELACLSVSTFLGYHIFSQKAFLLAPTLGLFPGTWSTLEAGLVPPRQPPNPCPGSWLSQDVFGNERGYVFNMYLIQREGGKRGLACLRRGKWAVGECEGKTDLTLL